ncbi:MAG: hypothetical protein GXP28_03640 [Planctomycetes bacterium]|nr:hypothetical protein [Planctomycetota bacterium]
MGGSNDDTYKPVHDWPLTGIGRDLLRCAVWFERRNGVETVEIDYAITSVPRDRADAGQLLAWWRGHWSITPERCARRSQRRMANRKNLP